MKIVNSNDIAELRWDSPGGRFLGFGKQLSEALGRDRTSSDALLRHPFDVELARVPAARRRVRTTRIARSGSSITS